MKKFLSALLALLIVLVGMPIGIPAGMPMSVTSVSAADNLNSLRGVHPRVQYNQADFNAFRSVAATEKMAPVYAQLLADCDVIAQNGAPDYYTDSNDEDLWMRSIGDNMYMLAFAYKLSGKAAYKNALYSMTQKVASYPSWGRGSFENDDLAAAHLLRGIAVYYDWLYNDMTSAQRTTVLNVLKEHGALISEREGFIGTVSETTGWWKKAYLQNHNWVCASAIMDVGFAIYDDYSTATTWMSTAKGNFDKVFQYLPSDGAYQEGLEYCNYSINFLTEYADNARIIYGTNYYSGGFLRNLEYFIANMILPKAKDNGSPREILNFADASSRLPSFQMIAYLAYFAKKTGDGEIQWLVDKLIENDPAADSLWQLIPNYDMNLVAEEPGESLQESTLFESLGYAFMRSGYDDDADVIALRCGRAVSPTAPTGDTKYDIGAHHVHPDVNHFILYSNGQKLLTDDGYAESHVANHNTLNVNGAGAYGDACDWEKPNGIDATPEITYFYEGDGYTFLSADGTAAYMPSAGLQSYVRKMLYLKDRKVLLVLDKAQLNSGNNQKLELRFFPGIAWKANLANGVLFDNGISQFEILPFANGNTVEYKNVNRTKDKSGTTQSVPAYCISSTTGSLLQPTALVWADKGETLAEVSIVEQTNEYVTFKISDGEDDLDHEIYRVSLSSDAVQKMNDDPTFDVTADYVAKTLTLSGSFPFSNTTESEVKITDNTSGDTVLATTINNIGATYSCPIALEQMYDGAYTVSMHNSRLGTILTKIIMLNPQISNLWVSACSLNEDSTKVTGNVSLKNTTAESKNVSVIMGAYNNGSLANVSIKGVTVNSNSELDDAVTLNKGQQYNNMKIFVWDEEMRPVTILN